MTLLQIAKLTPSEQDALLTLTAADQGSRNLHWEVTRRTLQYGTAEDFRERLRELRDDGEANPSLMWQMYGPDALIAILAATESYKLTA